MEFRNRDAKTGPPQNSPTAVYDKDNEYPAHVPDAEAVDSSPRPALSKTRKIILVAVLTNAYFLAAASSSSSLLIIPSISADLHIPALAAQWVSSAYTLANGCALLVAGRFADVYGRKHLFLIGLGINTVCTFICAFVRNLVPLCILRALAGLGQAFANPAAFGIAAISFPEQRERTIAFAVMGVGYPIGSALGQTFGGLIAGASGRAWSYQFFVLSGVGLIGVIAGYFIVPPESVKRDSLHGKIDWVGAAIIAIAMGLFGFSLTQSGLIHNGWTKPYIPALFALSITLIIAFGYWQHLMARWGKEPLIYLSLFKRKNWLVMWYLISALTACTSIAGWLYMTAMWYQTYKGETPIQNVLHVLPAPIMGIIACLIVPYLAPRIRAPILLFTGSFCASVACWLYPIQPLGLTYWACEFLSNLCTPFASDFTMGIGSVIVSNLAQGHEQSVLGAVFQTAIGIAGTLGPCLCSLVQEELYGKTGDLRHALNVAWWMLAGFGWLSCLIIVVFLRRVKLAKDVGQL